MANHIHSFVPVEVAWRKYWPSEIGPVFEPEPESLILACVCGAVKRIKAKLVKE
jgi:hypothetical protein